LSPDDSTWDDFIDRAKHKDFYYSREYHQLEAKRLNSEAYLLIIEHQEDFVALPMLLQPLSDIIGQAGVGKFDANCVYGYAGPIFNKADPSPERLDGYKRILEGELKRKGVVSLFARLHPLFDQHGICDDLGEVLQLGETISIDLTTPDSERRNQTRVNLKRNGRKAKHHGLEILEDTTWARLPEFFKVYNDTMIRVTAKDAYRFNSDYFENLRSAFGVRARLLLCLSGNDVVAGAIFVQTCALVQYHLAGTSTQSVKMSPMTLLILEAIRIFGEESQVLHLGGGVGGKRDGLYHFKSGFSRRRHPFRVWRWVIDRAYYLQACNLRTVTESGAYFPPYRTT
jgi:hypothetical protein